MHLYFCINQHTILDNSEIYVLQAFDSFNNEFDYFLNAMNYTYIYEIRQALYDPREDNFADFCNLESTR